MSAGRKLSAGLACLVLLASLTILLATMGRMETTAGWRKSEQNPVLGGALGTCFDVSVRKEGNTFRMWFSWRPRRSIALVESADGIHWSRPVIVLRPDTASGWQSAVNRPTVLKRPDGYHMWYTGQASERSWIGHAVSDDGRAWRRTAQEPVLSPEQPWEKVAVMCPHVTWDQGSGLYRMWYSGGEQYEPDAIGYATSPDGRHWTKWPENPIFRPHESSPWEKAKVTACHVVVRGGWHVMFYVGFCNPHRASIGIARSRDGITGWQRHPANPIIRHGRAFRWDRHAVYKPAVLLDGDRWLLWYNGRQGAVEQIGLAIHEGDNLGF